MVITKKIIVPAGQKEEELELTVEAEANQYIPFALDEVNLDFQILGPAPNNPDEVEVLIAASRKEKVEDRVAVAEAAGLKPRVMDVESYATQAAFELIAPSLPANGRDQNIALVDIGAHVTHFYVLRNDQFLFSRDQAFGGNQLTQDIQRAFNLSPEEAEAAKKNQGLPENYDTDVLQPFMETLALEVTRALQFFFTSTPYNQVDQILLAGGCALLPGLDELVAKRAGVAHGGRQPVRQHGDLRPRSGRASSRRTRRCCMVACGLAMRRFDDDPHQSAAAPRAEARRRASGSSSRSRSALAILGLAVVALVHVHPRRRRSRARRAATTLLKTEIAKLDKQIKEIDKLREQIAGAARAQAGRRDAAGQPHRGRAPARPAGAPAARRHLPASRSSSGAKVTLIGYAQSNARVSTLMRNIEASPWLEKPELVEIKSVAVARQPRTSGSTSSR